MKRANRAADTIGWCLVWGLASLVAPLLLAGFLAGMYDTAERLLSIPAHAYSWRHTVAFLIGLTGALILAYNLFPGSPLAGVWRQVLRYSARSIYLIAKGGLVVCNVRGTIRPWAYLGCLLCFPGTVVAITILTTMAAQQRLQADCTELVCAALIDKDGFVGSAQIISRIDAMPYSREAFDLPAIATMLREFQTGETSSTAVTALATDELMGSTNSPGRVLRILLAGRLEQVSSRNLPPEVQASRAGRILTELEPLLETTIEQPEFLNSSDSALISASLHNLSAVLYITLAKNFGARLDTLPPDLEHAPLEQFLKRANDHLSSAQTLLARVPTDRYSETLVDMMHLRLQNNKLDFLLFELRRYARAHLGSHKAGFAGAYPTTADARAFNHGEKLIIMELERLVLLNRRVRSPEAMITISQAYMILAHATLHRCMSGTSAGSDRQQLEQYLSKGILYLQTGITLGIMRNEIESDITTNDEFGYKWLCEPKLTQIAELDDMLSEYQQRLGQLLYGAD